MAEPPDPPELSWDSALEAQSPSPDNVPRETGGQDPPGSPPALDSGLSFLVAPGLLREGGLHLLGGSPFTGKTTIASQLLREFVAPVGFLSGLTFQRVPLDEIGVIFTDRPWCENIQWAQAVGLDFRHYALADDPYMAKKLRERPTSRVPGVELLTYALDQLPGAWLILADVFTTAFLGHDIFDQGSVHRHMLAIHRVLEERKITLIGTGYGSKQKQGKSERYLRAVDRIIGSASVRGSSSNLLYLETPEESGSLGYQVLTWFSRHAAERRYALSRGPQGLFQERLDVVLEGEQREPEPEPVRHGPRPSQEHEKVILGVLEPGVTMARPAVAQQAQEAGVPKASAYRTIKRLVKEGVLILRDGDILYRPPEN